MRYIAIFLFGILVPLIANGQGFNTSERPSWVDGYFNDRENSYIEVVTATGYSEENAREKASTVIVERRSLATGQHSQIKVDNGNIHVYGNDELVVKSRIIDQYTERLGDGVYRVSLLVQTAKDPRLDYEPVSVTNRYPFSARVFVPGMAQLHKGSTAKGICFIAGEVAAIGGIVAFECMRSSYESKINKTHNAELRKDYMTKADNMANIRNGFIVGAAAIYVWNIIDGAVAKGKTRVVVGNTSTKIIPYASTESAGIMLSMRF